MTLPISVDISLNRATHWPQLSMRLRQYMLYTLANHGWTLAKPTNWEHELQDMRENRAGKEMPALSPSM